MGPSYRPPRLERGGPVGASRTARSGYQAAAASAAADPDSGLRQVEGAYFEEVAIDAITPNPRQPRRDLR